MPGRQRQTDLCEFKVCWRTPLIPALGRQRQADLCAFKDSVVYRVSSRTKIHRNPVSKRKKKAGRWWCTPLILALGRQRQADLWEIEACLVYKSSSRTGTKATEKPCLKKPKKKVKRNRV